MKKWISAFAAFLLCSAAWSQEDKAKTGWNFSVLPDLGYSTDLGFNLGAFGDLFYYGDGSIYPNYLHHIGFTGTYLTKGSWYVHAFMDSDALIPGIGLSLSATYRDVLANNFYGFNGIASPYDASLDRNKVTQTAYYTNRRRFARVSALAEGKIVGHLSWMAGGVFRRIWIDDFSLNDYHNGHSLYLDYINSGLIRADEAHGGTNLEIKAGLRYDSRDIQRAPGKGIYGELYLLSNFDLGGKPYHYGQLVADFRHFIPIIPRRIVFAYHLALQHTLWGEVPFYNANELSTPLYIKAESTGLGSRYNIRGYLYNRITAAGYAWGNFELRCTPFIFTLFNQYIELVANPFIDLGCITKSYRLEEQRAMGADYYQNLSLPVMASAGIGGKLQVNHNFILSVDFAKAFHSQLSEFMVGMGTAYVF